MTTTFYFMVMEFNHKFLFETNRKQTTCTKWVFDMFDSLQFRFCGNCIASFNCGMSENIHSEMHACERIFHLKESLVQSRNKAETETARETRETVVSFWFAGAKVGPWVTDCAFEWKGFVFVSGFTSLLPTPGFCVAEVTWVSRFSQGLLNGRPLWLLRFVLLKKVNGSLRFVHWRVDY